MIECLIKDVHIGKGKPKVCLPVIGTDENEIINQIQAFEGLDFDLIELRIDFYKNIKDNQKIIDLLHKVRLNTNKPLLLTYRSLKEGGKIQLSDEEYLKLIEAVSQSHCIDIVDIELMSGNTLVYQLVEMAHQNDIKVIMSNHDFQATPSVRDMMDCLEKMELLGADICKLAVMPQTYKDVIALLNVTIEMSHKLHIPLVTMSMGQLGVISRMTGELTGSAITFASAGKPSAPGQMGVKDLQMILEAVHYD
ncbi:type I 3-dehydroquinate dehydratase [Candidatus Stoquefichus massiliensis]|uniref:type I 3-dehydroquinate dehydratase n=1 Tax=Candidatus Stoquefichus massiliensis TaxID=1470350 RepID=UPI0004846E27|nr:type I 3-dehydroquinate dehydratase [Candidatus Stoquefichus massiliensis]